MTLQEAMIDSTWCRHSKGHSGNWTEIAAVLRVLNKCGRVKGSAVTRVGMKLREGATESGRCTTARREIRPEHMRANKKTGRSKERGNCSFSVSTDLYFDKNEAKRIICVC